VARQVRIGHLAFGVAFLVIALGWLVGEPVADADLAWITAVTAIALGAAGLVTVLARLFR
jgi:hypothetical protein